MEFNLDPEQIEDEIGSMDAKELDLLPFGVIRLDENGRVIEYNAYEEKLANRASDEVIGKSFFDEVAPCTRVREFEGRFRNSVAEDDLKEVFDFDFQFPDGPRSVRIRMISTGKSEPGAWIFVTPMETDSGS